jgi:hypothetical protein
MKKSESLAAVSNPAASKTPGDFDEASRFNRRGLFIGGCPKSGTSLLLALLDNHPELVVLPRETHYLDQGRKYRALGSFQAKLHRLLTRSDLCKLDQGQFDYPGFARLAGDFMNQPWIDDSLLLSETIRAYMVTMGHNWRDCLRWVEKTPSNVPFANDLFRLFPEAKLIQIVRDPRAVFASRRRHLTNRYGCHGKAHRLIREWNESSRQINKLRERPDKYLLVHYEDLVQKSRVVMDEVCQFAGIKFRPTLLEPTIEGRQWAGNSAFYTAFSGIDTHPVDQWKKEMTEDEIWWVDLHCREGMKITGYQTQTDAGFSFSRWARRLPSESWSGYLRARRGSLCQMAGVLEDCRYDPVPETLPAKTIPKPVNAPSSVQIGM